MSGAARNSNFRCQWIQCAYDHEVATAALRTDVLCINGLDRLKHETVNDDACRSHHWSTSCMHIHLTEVCTFYVNSLWSCGRHTLRLYNTKDWMTRLVSYRIATAHAVNSGCSKLLFALWQLIWTRSCTSSSSRFIVHLQNTPADISCCDKQ